ncbi:hypothetical protein [uncultured Methanobrevibacter sp.]|uniref:tetratricopeptide repeat protein n=1 Tax=uncultured Methanobrevibacter sp. TaxID=253161 RepID=UPI0025D06229|nr:hypothetical protein [uncultured Methanobrevibacter sp.]
MADLDKDFDEAYKYYEEKEYDKSLEIFENLYNENYKIEEVIPPMVDLYLAKEDYESGLKYVNIILDLEQDNLEALSIKSYILTYMDRLDEALEVAEKIIQLDPNVEEGYLLKISILHLQSKDDEINEFVDDLEKNYPIVLEGIFELTGLSAQDLKTGITPEFDENIEIFEEVDHDYDKCDCDDSHHHHYHDGDCCDHEHKREEELNPEERDKILEGIYDEIDQNVEDEVEKYLYKANGAAQFEKYDEAIDFIDKALEIDEENLDGLLLKSAILFNQMKFEMALDSINRVIDLYPENIDALTFKGFVHLSLGDFESAENSFKNALEIDDNDLEVYRQYSFAVASNGDLNRALGINQKALKKFEDSSDLWYDKYYFLKQLGSNSNAKKALDKSLELNPNQQHYDGTFVNYELNNNVDVEMPNDLHGEMTDGSVIDNNQIDGENPDFQLSGEEERLFKILSEKGYDSAKSTELVLGSYQAVMFENPDVDDEKILFKKVVDLVEEKIKKEEENN